MFVTFEGLDGSGKSTQARLLQEHLAEAGRAAVLTREPGGTPVGEGVRALVLDAALDISPWSEAALFAAARAELVERVIGPALERGDDVVCDRYIDSSLAYQGIARALGVDRVLELNLHATRGLLPDRTFLLVVDAQESARRVGGEPDRIEREGDGFRARVARAYGELAELFPGRVVPVDGTRPAPEIADLIRGQVRDLL
ncbi:MAG: dTMP kinase [Gaiellaceae bacterium]